MARLARTVPLAPLRAPSRRMIFAVAVGAAAIAGFLPSSGAGADADAELAMLLRFMAFIKGLMAVGAVALAWWRIGLPLTAGLFAAYTGVVVAMAAATGLIWTIDHVVAGAALFHAGLFGLIGLAIADDDGRTAVSHAVGRRRTLLRHD